MKIEMLANPCIINVTFSNPEAETRSYELAVTGPWKFSDEKSEEWVKAVKDTVRKTFNPHHLFADEDFTVTYIIGGQVYTTKL